MFFFCFPRYGSDLASVESFRQNNFTASLAAEFLGVASGDPDGNPEVPDGLSGRQPAADDGAYWLGLQAYNELQTNTLEADAGHQVIFIFARFKFPFSPQTRK